MAAFTLRGVSGPCSGRRFGARSGCLTLGRVDGNDVVLADAGVSRRHLRIRSSGGAWIVEDMGSSNGTFVDGRRLERPVVLRGGERIRAGESELVFEADRRGDPSPAPPRSGRRRRVLLATTAGALVLLAGAGLVARRAVARAGGIVAIDALRESDVFGVGPDVTVSAPAEARFTFAGRDDTVFTLRYRAAEIAWEGLVEVRLNGSVIGHVAPAAAEPEDRELELPRGAIRPGTNELAFAVPRNLREPLLAWRVASPRLVREPIPACGGGCLEQAREHQRVARSQLEHGPLDPASLHRASAALARARLLLAAVPERTQVHEENRHLLAQARESTERLCARLRFTATRHFALDEPAQAEAAARRILEAFPSDEHACHQAGLHMLHVLGVRP